MGGIFDFRFSIVDSSGQRRARIRSPQVNRRGDDRQSKIQNPKSKIPSVSAFTLIEMMVVIGIILVLVALAVPTAFSLVSDSRVRLTRATMSVMEMAIEQFSLDKPFARNHNMLRRISNPNPPHNRLLQAIPDIFGSYPPSPTTAFSINPALDPPDYNSQADFVSNGLGLNTGRPLPIYPATKEDDTDPPAGSATQTTTIMKFLRLIHRIENVQCSEDLNNCRPWIMRNEVGNQIQWGQEPQYPKPWSSSECLIYSMREFSKGAREVLDKLPPGSLTNRDKDFVFLDVGPPCSPPPDCPPCPCGNGTYDPAWEKSPRRVLFEVQDPWKRPFRYAIREATRDLGDLNSPPTTPLMWELRSAGEDGIFALPFSDPAKSDDVILRGT